jgi:uncharacterized RDD family membrane protein YckC
MESLPYADQSIELPPALSGDLSKERILASVCDNLLAPILAVTVAGASGATGDVARGSIGVAAYLAYFFLCEGLLGATPGKLLFGLRVKRTSGQPASWLQTGIRTLLRLIEVNPIVIGSLPACILIAATPKRQRLGDLLAGTIVVSKASLQRT